jgi:hypothetical protein
MSIEEPARYAEPEEEDKEKKLDKKDKGRQAQQEGKA